MKIKISHVAPTVLKCDDLNPRVNDGAVAYVENSIRAFGFLVPVVVDEDMVLLAGHTRLKAALELGLEEIPCYVKEGLTPEQKDAYRIADNRSGELSLFDFDKVAREILRLDGFDFTDFGFEPVDVKPPEVDPLSVEGVVGKGAVVCPRCGKVVA